MQKGSIQEIVQFRQFFVILNKRLSISDNNLSILDNVLFNMTNKQLSKFDNSLHGTILYKQLSVCDNILSYLDNPFLECIVQTWIAP